MLFLLVVVVLFNVDSSFAVTNEELCRNNDYVKGCVRKDGGKYCQCDIPIQEVAGQIVYNEMFKKISPFTKYVFKIDNKSFTELHLIQDSSCYNVISLSSDGFINSDINNNLCGNFMSLYFSKDKVYKVRGQLFVDFGDQQYLLRVLDKDIYIYLKQGNGYVRQDVFNNTKLVGSFRFVLDEYGNDNTIEIVFKDNEITSNLDGKLNILNPLEDQTDVNGLYNFNFDLGYSRSGMKGNGMFVSGTNLEKKFLRGPDLGDLFLLDNNFCRTRKGNDNNYGLMTPCKIVTSNEQRVCKCERTFEHLFIRYSDLPNGKLANFNIIGINPNYYSEQYLDPNVGFWENILINFAANIPIIGSYVKEKKDLIDRVNFLRDKIYQEFTYLSKLNLNFNVNGDFANITGNVPCEGGNSICEIKCGSGSCTVKINDKDFKISKFDIGLRSVRSHFDELDNDISFVLNDGNIKVSGDSDKFFNDAFDVIDFDITYTDDSKKDVLMETDIITGNYVRINSLLTLDKNYMTLKFGEGKLQEQRPLEVDLEKGRIDHVNVDFLNVTNINFQNSGGYAIIAFLNRVIEVLVRISAALAVTFMVWAGFLLIVSGSNSARADSAKNSIYGSITALFIIYMSYIIVNVLMDVLYKGLAK